MSLFSLIVPTRARVPQLRRFLQTVCETAHDPASLEVIAVIDDDDRETQAFSFTHVKFTPVLVRPGQTMGNLNLAGYRAARGEYLMLVNDDVAVRTDGWDKQLRQVLGSYSDGVVLAHVNDLLFRDTLCTFPAMTRAFCEMAGGICPAQYRRYRIDDHIHHVFDLIHLLGHTRRVYLPDVVFEHDNLTRDSAGALVYAPEPAVHGSDSELFEKLISERRRLAVDCVDRIEGSSAAAERAGRLRRLEAFPDPLAVRRREHAQWWRLGNPLIPTSNRYRYSASARGRFWLENTAAELAARSRVFRWLGGGIPKQLFDAAWYRKNNPDVRDHRNLLLHYLRHGGFEGRDPNPHFDSAWYLETNPDVAASGLNPLVHFVRHGASEYRSPNLLFDLRYYESQNPEAAGSGVNLLGHFISQGLPDGQSPLASLTAGEYDARLHGIAPASIRVTAPAPLSIVIPTRNRKDVLARTVDACARVANGLDCELIVVDDGSTDGTAEQIREHALKTPRLRVTSVSAGGPARARNLGAAQARHDVIVFLGDDIVPANDDFLRIHALKHAEHPQPDFALLGKVEWPRDPDFCVNFAMAEAQSAGTQFAYSRLRPGNFAGWQYFYTSNLSVKKALFGDWITGGFDAGFSAAALEDIELGYRVWRSRQGLRLYYDPASLGLHYHHHTLTSLLHRQNQVGQSVRRMLDLHPELLDEYGIRNLLGALQVRPIPEGDQAAHRLKGRLDAVKDWAVRIEARGGLGSEAWHSALVAALLELSVHEGYVLTWPGQEVNLAAARKMMLDVLFSRIRNAAGLARFAFWVLEIGRGKTR